MGMFTISSRHATQSTKSHIQWQTFLRRIILFAHERRTHSHPLFQNKFRWIHMISIHGRSVRHQGVLRLVNHDLERRKQNIFAENEPNEVSYQPR